MAKFKPALARTYRDMPFTQVFSTWLKTVRGGHAHRGCSQFMICTQGVIEINCDDGREQRSFILDRGNVGLLLPPNMWATQRFCHENSVLLVVCDQPYEEQDYIRNYAEFLAWRNINPAVWV